MAYGLPSSSAAYESLPSSLKIPQSFPQEDHATCGGEKRVHIQDGTHVQRSLTNLASACYEHSSRLRIMPSEPGYHNRQRAIISKISSFFYSLDHSTYNKVAPKIEFWIEYAFAEHSTTVDKLVGEVSLVAWNVHPSYPSVVRFLKAFRDAPHRSEQVSSSVYGLCTHILRWFGAASAENLSVDPKRYSYHWGVAVSGETIHPSFATLDIHKAA